LSGASLFLLPESRTGRDLLCSVTLQRIEGGLAPGKAVKCPNGAAAIWRAQVMSNNQSNAGVVVFSRRGDLNLGEFGDAIILKTFGEVPDDLHFRAGGSCWSGSLSA
jgi:hypothetical protein